MSMKNWGLFLVVFLLAAISFGFPANYANAKVCGCIFDTLQWKCFADGACRADCRSNEKMFPDMESCRRRSTVPAQSVRRETVLPKNKVAQVPESKKPAARPEKKKVAAVPPPQKPKVVERKAAPREQESVQSKVAAATPQLKQASVKPNQEASNSATSVASAVAPGPTPETPPLLSALPDKQVLGRRIALVIGNSRYVSVPALTNPAPDAKAIAESLLAAGFEKVKLKLDLDRQSLWTALSEFAQESRRADWAVIYFAGHGIELDGQNYVIPTDAKLETDSEVLFETVPLDHMVEATAGARKFRLVILDACRNNPFLATMSRVASTRSIGRGLSRVEPHGGVLVAYAAKAGEVALDGDAGNSPFVRALIEQIARPGVEVGFLFRKVRDSVLKQTAGAQEPYTYGSLPGDEELYFRPPPN
jgi:Caspase domain